LRFGCRFSVGGVRFFSSCQTFLARTWFEMIRIYWRSSVYFRMLIRIGSIWTTGLSPVLCVFSTRFEIQACARVGQSPRHTSCVDPTRIAAAVLFVRPHEHRDRFVTRRGGVRRTPAVEPHRRLVRSPARMPRVIGIAPQRRGGLVRSPVSNTATDSYRAMCRWRPCAARRFG